MFAQLPGVQSALTALSADDPHEIGGYRLHARLGSGGMGVVYLAYTPGGRPIALKAVRREFAADPEFRERFAQEVASARRIHGLFTAQVVDSGEDDHTPWLATAYVPGPRCSKSCGGTGRCRCGRCCCSSPASPRPSRRSTGWASSTGTSNRRTC